MGIGSNLAGFNLFAFCGNNPITGYDPEGHFDWGTFFSGAGLVATGLTALAAAATIITCGAAAPLMVAVATVTAAAGALTVVNGAAEVVEAGTGYNVVRDGAFGGAAAVVASLGVGAISGITTAINTEGNTMKKIAAGVTAGIVAGFGTYLGTRIPVARDTAFTTGFTSFAGGLFMGAQTEIINVTTQHAVSKIFTANTGNNSSTRSISQPTLLKPTHRIILAQ